MYKLRPYQEEACDKTWEYIRTKRGNPVVAISTGGGKSIVNAELIRRAIGVKASVRCAMLTHQKELIEQNYQKLRALLPREDLGVYSASLKKRDLSSRISCLGIQSIYDKAAILGAQNLLIVDECHLINNNLGEKTMYGRFIADLLKMNPRMRIVGLSATPFRTNQGYVTQGDVFDTIVYKTKVKELQEQGYLSKLVTLPSSQTFNTAGAAVRGGEFTKKALSQMAAEFNTEGAVQEFAEQAKRRRSAVVFCVSVDHARKTTELLKACGVQTALLHGKTPQRERDEILRGLKVGAIKCVANVNVLTTGFDAPLLDLIGVLRPTHSPGLWCLDEKTEVLTKDGFKTYAQLKANDLVLSPETETLKADWEKPIAILKKTAAHRNFVTYDSKMLSLKVTENHEMLFRRRRTKLGWRKIRATHLAEYKDGFYIPTATHVDYPGVPLTGHELSFLGLVATDGTIDKSNNAIRIYQSTKKEQARVCELIERTLKGCMFKYRKFTRKASTLFGEGFDDINVWQISKGNPRSNGNHLRGWGALEAYVHKAKIPYSLVEGMTREQFEVYLEAVHAGDGYKQPKNVNWKQNNWHIGQKHKTYIEHLQLMCITRGISANIATEERVNGPFYTIHIKKRDRRTIGGANQLDRPRLQKTTSNEMVWCIQTPSGNIVTRRNGKVCVMGNCQMIGRGLRIAPGKEDCLVMDYGGNLERNGPLDDLNIPQPPRRGGAAVMKTCPSCTAQVFAGCKICPHCDLKFKFAERVEDCKTDRAARGNIVFAKLGVGRREYTVKRQIIVPYTTKAGRKVLRVDYRDLDDKVCASEYVDIDAPEHWKQQMARTWWYQRDDKKDFPSSLRDAIPRLRELNTPKRIEVRRNGKYWNVCRALF